MINGVGRPRRRKKRGRQKKQSKNIWLFLLLLSLLLLTLFYLYKHETETISARADEFMIRVSAGELDAARELMTAGKEELDKLHGLMEQESIGYKRIKSSYLLGIMKGAAEVMLTHNNKVYPVKLTMVREDGFWLVSALPPLDVLYGAFVIEENPITLRVLYRGEKSRYRLREKIGAQYGEIVYMVVLGDNVLSVEKTERVPVSRVMVRKEAEIEGEKEGVFPLYAGGPEVYVVDRENKTVESGRVSDLIVGRTDVSFYLFEKKVLAAVTGESFKPGEIRVVLNDSSGQGLYHREVRISGDTAFTLEVPGAGNGDAGYRREAGESEGEEGIGESGGATENMINIPANRQITICSSAEGIAVRLPGGEQAVFNRRILLRPAEKEEGRFFIADLRRDGWGKDIPAYRGMLDIFAGDEGLVVVNELPVEDYLRAVVPGEMPASFGPEPLKLQAIVSRAYAYRHILDSRYHAYGAHVDDSVNSQVYNHRPEDNFANQAIRETKGLVPFHDNEPIEAFFFSTSCGYTANPEEVWTTQKKGFPGEGVPYLFAHSQVPGEVFELASEENLIRFIDTEYEEAYDSAAPFFRWQITMSRRDFEETVSRNMEEQYRRRPEQVLTMEGHDFVSREISADPLGRLLDIRTLERGDGGNMMVLEIEGSRGTYRLVSEYTIRFTIRPVQYRSGAAPVILQRADGSEVENFSVLPSAFAYFAPVTDEDGDIREIKIRGGGYGHGVGLSQYGARGMAEKGFDFVQIIEHYYPGTRLHNIYEQ